MIAMKMKPFLLSLFMLAWLPACTGGTEEALVVTQVVEIGGEDIEVTRVLQQARVTAATSTPVAGDSELSVLDVGREGNPGTPDPQKGITANEMLLIENLFVGLTRYNQASGVIEPALASSWTVSDDGLVWTFNLREDIFWIKPALPESGALLERAAGTTPYRPVLADDVVYAIQRACRPETEAPDVLVLFIIAGCEAVHSRAVSANTEGDVAQAIGVRAPDDSTVEFTLTEQASYFPAITSMGLLRPVPRELVEPFNGTGESWASAQNIVTSGPFILGPESNENRTVLNRNPYWPDAFSGTVDVANIYWEDVDSAYELWLEKDLDVTPLPAGMREEILADNRLRPRLHLVTNQAVFYLAYNFDSPVFSDPAVRRAFGAAIDREVLVEEVYANRGLPMRHFSPPGVFGAPPPDMVGIGYNADRARLEMRESGLQDCQFIPEIRYMVGTTDLALHHAEIVRSMWQRELGCPEEKIVIEQVQFGTLLASTRPEAGSERPDIWDLGWASYFPDAHNWLGEVLHCRVSENRQNRPCMEADTLLARAAEVHSGDERLALYRQAEGLFFAEGGVQPIAPLFVQGRYVLVHPWLVYQPAHFGGEQFDTYMLNAVEKRLERQQ